jgi:hypothetical protein
MYELPVWDHRYYRSEQILRRYELPVLPVWDRYYQWLAEKDTVLHENELPVLPGTGTTGGAWPVVPVGVYSESDFQISNRFGFR